MIRFTKAQEQRILRVASITNNICIVLASGASNYK